MTGPIVLPSPAYSRLGRFEEGIDLLVSARQILPGEFWPTAFLGCAYLRAGRQSDVKLLLAELEGATIRFLGDHSRRGFGSRRYGSIL
jgi:hypothetical protein